MRSYLPQRPTEQARRNALAARASIPQRGAAAADSAARRASNRKPAKATLAAQAAAVAAWNAGATHAPDRMQRKEDATD